MGERKLETPGDEAPGSVDVSELIAARAHEIFQSRGGGLGHDLDDWLQAEREVHALKSGAAEFSPAEDQQLAAKAGAATGFVENKAQGSEASARTRKKE